MTGEHEAPVITLITPMFNESARIQQSIRALLETIGQLGVSWEYILVDDGSRDDSLSKAKEVLDGRPQCRIIHYGTNRGRGYALRQGFAAARGQYVITTESDLSWGPQIIQKLYTALLETRADMVIASVYLPGGGMENVPAVRFWCSKIGNRIMRWAFGGKLTMISGMTRAYRRPAIQSLYLEEDSKEIHLEIVSKAQAVGMQIVEIPAWIRWETAGPGQRRRDGLKILRFALPHLLVSFHLGSVRLLAWSAVITGVLGGLTVILGTLHKIFRILPLPLPNLVIYGLMLCVMSLVCALFLLVSIQLKFTYRSMVHLQSQNKQVHDRLQQCTIEEPAASEP